MEPQDVVVAVAFRWQDAPTPNHFTSREDRRKPKTIESQLWDEGPMPMDRLEALLQQRLKDER